jgi:hypothetical protein
MPSATASERPSQAAADAAAAAADVDAGKSQPQGQRGSNKRGMRGELAFSRHVKGAHVL